MSGETIQDIILGVVLIWLMWDTRKLWRMFTKNLEDEREFLLKFKQHLESDNLDKTDD